jgi:predicted transport protein
MQAVKELYNAEIDLQKFLQETKQNTPAKTSEIVLETQDSVDQKGKSECLKLPLSWKKKLEDNNEQVKLMVDDLMLSIANEFSDLTTQPKGDDFQLFKGQTGSKYRFAVLTLRKDGVSVRLRVNIRTLIDPQKWISEKTYKWYFNDGNGEEKEIKITQQDQIGYATELLKQSYALAK